MSISAIASQRIPRHASCPECDLAVLAAGSKCPWCDGPLTPPDVVDQSMHRALEVTTLIQLLSHGDRS